MKSEVMVSWLFNLKLAPVWIVASSVSGFLGVGVTPGVVPIVRRIPPLINGKANAFGFNIMVPISGNNHP